MGLPDRSFDIRGPVCAQNWYFDKRGPDNKPLPIPKWMRWADEPFPEWNHYSGTLLVSCPAARTPCRLQVTHQSELMSAPSMQGQDPPNLSSRVARQRAEPVALAVGEEDEPSARRRLQLWHDGAGEHGCFSRLREQGLIRMSP